MHVKELTTVDEMLAVYDIQSQMYPDMTRAQYEQIITQRIADGYRMLAVFDEDVCICTAGFWIGVRFYCGKFIQLDNMVTDANHQRKGVGKAVVNWIKELGKNEGCARILVDTYVENFDAHRFFLREGFIIRGYHLNYGLQDSHEKKVSDNPLGCIFAPLTRHFLDLVNNPNRREVY